MISPLHGRSYLYYGIIIKHPNKLIVENHVIYSRFLLICEELRRRIQTGIVEDTSLILKGRFMLSRCM
ncbi:unnamed protein product [Lactuca virosa]|uniref:Uncharacterized protein n=1 Tax=Lactuca virosa TaxID=75947 RepID=A0AAU9LR13_9ASTR|nr:unnamed protein product [Lactuca virosa]